MKQQNNEFSERDLRYALTAYIDEQIWEDANIEFTPDPINNDRSFIDFIKKHANPIFILKENTNNNKISTLNALLTGWDENSEHSVISDFNIDAVNPYDPYQVFFISSSTITEENRKMLKEYFMVGDENNYFELFRSLKPKKSYSYTRNWQKKSLLNEFEDLLPKTLAREVIIIDPYLFWPVKENDIGPVERTEKILQVLKKKFTNLNKIVIYTRYHKNVLTKDELKKIRRITESNHKIKLLLIYFTNEYTEHDRYIITSNYNINSGSSLQAILCNSKITSSFTIKVDSFVDKEIINHTRGNLLAFAYDLQCKLIKDGKRIPNLDMGVNLFYNLNNRQPNV